MVAVLVALGMGAWWLVRSDAVAALRAVHDDDLDDEVGAAADQPVDAATLSKATDDGMSHAWGPSDIASIPAPRENGELEPSALG